MKKNSPLLRKKCQKWLLKKKKNSRKIILVSVVTLVSPMVPLCMYMRSKFSMHICGLFCYSDNFSNSRTPLKYSHFNNHNHAAWWFFRSIYRIDCFHEIQTFEANLKILLYRVIAILQ